MTLCSVAVQTYNVPEQRDLRARPEVKAVAGVPLTWLEFGDWQPMHNYDYRGSLTPHHHTHTHIHRPLSPPFMYPLAPCCLALHHPSWPSPSCTHRWWGEPGPAAALDFGCGKKKAKSQPKAEHTKPGAGLGFFSFPRLAAECRCPQGLGGKGARGPGLRGPRLPGVLPAVPKWCCARAAGHWTRQ